MKNRPYGSPTGLCGRLGDTGMSKWPKGKVRQPRMCPVAMVPCRVSTRMYQILPAQSRAGQDMICRGHLWNPVTSPRGEDVCPILPNSTLSNWSIYAASLGQVSKRATTNQNSCSVQRRLSAPLPWLRAEHSRAFFSWKVYTVLCKSGPLKIKIILLLRKALFWKKRVAKTSFWKYFTDRETKPIPRVFHGHFLFNQ